MPILVDLHPLVISSVAVNLKDEGKNPNLKNLIKHMFFSTILQIKKKFGGEFGELIFCTDSDRYWRKEVFPYYKGGRAAKKEESDLNWEYIHEAIDDIKADIKANFKFKVIEVDRAEADDVIAVMVKYFQTNELIESMFGDDAQQILIVAGDGDFVQLQKYKNVKQYSQRFKKFIVPKTTLREHVITHIVKAGDDGIPNILSEDGSIVNKIRQHAIKQAYLERFFEEGEAACTTDLERKNWKRNQTLVDFEYIPMDVQESILHTYREYQVKGNKTKVMNYFLANGMRVLFGELAHF
jgi:hypothetical protein